MNPDTAISVSHVSKKYLIGVQKDGSLRGSLAGMIGSKNAKPQEEFFALNDVSLEIKKGEVIGIIGKNGAGKSTLLKILSQITKPTAGRIEINGRVASLLEVGTGFHPELTGRENIYLNGTILGMTRQEVKDKFDEIVEFSGVQKFIDTPVKHYSSGMYVRLAFAVAAHLEPEILIIDEVLAVGDAEFQKKCLGKMKEVAGKGRTVIFVSHNMAAVKTLCSSGVYLKDGKIEYFGEICDALNKYMSNGKSFESNQRFFKDALIENKCDLKNISVYNRGKLISDIIEENKDLIVETEIEILDVDPNKIGISYHLINEMGESLFSFGSNRDKIILKSGKNKLRTVIPAGFLQASTYSLVLLIVEDKKRVIFSERDAIIFNIVEGGREIGVYMGKEPGYIKPSFQWENN